MNVVLLFYDMGKIRYYFNKIKEGKLKDKLMIFKWIYGYAINHIPAIVIYTLLGMTGIILGLFTSLNSRDLVDIITGHRTGELLRTFTIMIVLTVVNTCVSQISSYLSTKISLKVNNEIKAQIFEGILRTDWQSLSKYHSGDLVMRCGSDASNIASGILTLVPNLIIYIFRFASALYMVCIYDWTFAIFALASIPITLISSRYSMKMMRKSGMGTMSASARMNGFHQETFSNIQTIKAFDMLSYHIDRLKEIQKGYSEATLKYQKISMLNTFILTFVSMLVSYSAQAWGVYKVWNGAITYGTMTMFIGLSSSLTGSVSNLISFVPTSLSLFNSADRVKSILDLPRDDYSNAEEVEKFGQEHAGKGIGVEARNVSFAYEGAENVFSKAEFNANPHETVAFVGPSGEGKTTMLRLLLAIIRPGEGQVRITTGDGELEDSLYATAATRSLFAYVPQGNTMFSGTIAQNMRNVKKDATDDEIIKALKMACAWDFVKKLPEGINSEMGEHGSGFSEGQAQRLSIARAILRQSPILLLDEATSALDVWTEKEVLKNIMADEYPRTTIITTHRPSVLKQCDRVYAIRNGNCCKLSDEEISEMESIA